MEAVAGAKRVARFVLRSARAVLRRAGLGPPPRKPYKPAFDEQALAQRLGIELALGTDAPIVGDDLAYAGARRARQLFGQRFFVAPDQVQRLAQQVRSDYPDAVAGLLSRVRADAESGLPLYSGFAGAVGEDFDWATLPVGPGDDAMYKKRPHRFAFVPRHAWACLYDSSHATVLRGMLESWMRYAEKGTDLLCYDSNLGVIQRVLALTWAWAFLAGRDEQAHPEGLGLEWMVLRIIFADVQYLEPGLGDAVPNNHLLADLFAHWYLATVLGDLLNADAPDAERRWCDELLAQTYADGGNFEHSSHYHEFACEMSAAYIILCRQNDRQPDDAVLQRTRALLAYQCVLTGPEAMPVAIGNAVEDTLFPLDIGESWCSGALREIYRGLFDDELNAAPVDDVSIVRAFWLLGGAVAAPRDDCTDASLPRHFASAGLCSFADDEQRARLVFRTGVAPGDAVYGGHMHADYLAVYLHLDGRPLLVDAGTFSYRGLDRVWADSAANWRQYFSGPWAHNCLTLGDEDPIGSLIGDFRYREPAARVTLTHAEGRALSCCEGTIRSENHYDGVRRVVVHLQGALWLLLDTIPRREEQSPRQGGYGFQCAADVQTSCTDGAIQLCLPGSQATVSIIHSDDLDTPQVLEASLDPVGGWLSPRYGERIGAPQVRYAITASTSASAFLLSTNARYRHARILRCEAQDHGACLVAFTAEDADHVVVYQPAHPVAWDMEAGTLEFDGRLLWLKLDDKGRVAIHWLGGRSIRWLGRSIDVCVRDEHAGEFAIDEHADLAEIGARCLRLVLPTFAASGV